MRGQTCTKKFKVIQNLLFRIRKHYKSPGHPGKQDFGTFQLQSWMNVIFYKFSYIYLIFLNVYLFTMLNNINCHNTSEVKRVSIHFQISNLDLVIQILIETKMLVIVVNQFGLENAFFKTERSENAVEIFGWGQVLSNFYTNSLGYVVLTPLFFL